MLPDFSGLTGATGLPIEAIVAIATGVGAIGIAAIRAYLKGDTAKARGLYVRIESRLRSILRKRGVGVQPAVSERDRSTISEALDGVFGDREDVKLVYTDGTYSVTDRAGIETMGAHDILQYAPYRPEVYDCEEFAQLFDVSAELVYGVSAIGVVYDWSAGHAYNVIVLEDDSVLLYEPQDGVLLELGDKHTFDAITGETTVTYDPSNALIVI